ncbi:hypothetical protein GCM10027063_48120 [Promicromonospora xylanilytica]
MDAGLWIAAMAPLSAFGGAVWGSLWSGRTMIRTEQVRARHAEEAEDRRVQAEIRAEDRRHESALRLARLERNLDAVRSLYVELETARRKLEAAEVDLIAVLQNQARGDQSRGLDEARQVYAGTIAEFGLVRDRASLDASDAVKDYADLLYFSALAASRDNDLLRADDLVKTASNSTQFVLSKPSETQRASGLLSGMMRGEFRAEIG